MLAEQYLENLDGSWPDDLRAYAKRLHDLATQLAVESQPKPPKFLADHTAQEDSRIARRLALYAGLKANAMAMRAEGDIVNATKLERDYLEPIYRSLPDYAKW